MNSTIHIKHDKKRTIGKERGVRQEKDGLTRHWPNMRRWIIRRVRVDRRTREVGPHRSENEKHELMILHDGMMRLEKTEEGVGKVDGKTEERRTLKSTFYFLLESGLVPVLRPCKKQGSDLNIIFSFEGGGETVLALPVEPEALLCELIARSFKLCSRASTLAFPSPFFPWGCGTSTTRNTALPSTTFRTFSISQSFLFALGTGDEENASQKDEVSFDINVCETREAMMAC